MRGRFFIDTNILVHANDTSNPEKRSEARLLIARALETRRGCLSTQVLQEFFVVVTSKAGVAPENARAQILILGQLDTVIPDEDLIVRAVDLHIIHHVSFWDALIVQAARSAGCGTLLTEDLQDGQVIEGVRVENPFRS